MHFFIPSWKYAFESNFVITEVDTMQSSQTAENRCYFLKVCKGKHKRISF